MGKKYRCAQITDHEKNCVKRKKWKENIEVLTTTIPAASLNNRRFSWETKRLFSLVLKRCSARRGIGFGKCAFIRASLKPRYSSIFPSIEVFHAFSRVNSATKDKQSEPIACRWMPRLVFGILCIDRFDRAWLLAFTLQTWKKGCDRQWFDWKLSAWWVNIYKWSLSRWYEQFFQDLELLC